MDRLDGLGRLGSSWGNERIKAQTKPFEGYH
jgi:hypothetical protein